MANLSARGRENLIVGQKYLIHATDHSVNAEFIGTFIRWEQTTLGYGGVEIDPDQPFDVETWRAVFDTGWAEGWRWSATLIEDEDHGLL